MPSKKTPFFIVYEVLNTVNGKRYIGITNYGLAHRWRRHLRASRRLHDARYSTALGHAIAKHGEEAFSVRQIASARTWDDLLALERLLIVQEGTRCPTGYNMTGGGEGNHGIELRPETKALISAANKGRKRGPMSEAHRAAISATKRGRPPSPEHRAALSRANLGKTLTPETRAKVSAVQVGKKLTAEHRSNIAAARTGTKLPPSAVAKLVARHAANREKKARARENLSGGS